MTCATVKSLLEIKDVTEDDAKLIRKVWNIVGATALRDFLARPAINDKGRFNYALEQRGSVNIKQAAVNRILGTHGVEYLGKRKGNRNHVYYCNAGDTYATTVLFDGDHLRVGTWGDLVERDLMTDTDRY